MLGIRATEQGNSQTQVEEREGVQALGKLRSVSKGRTIKIAKETAADKTVWEGRRWQNGVFTN